MNSDVYIYDVLLVIWDKQAKWIYPETLYYNGQ